MLKYEGGFLDEKVLLERVDAFDYDLGILMVSFEAGTR